MSRLLRRDQLCPGAEVCPEVPPLELDPLPCEECPRVRLDDYMQFTEEGRRIGEALDLDRAIKCGLQVRLEDVTYPELVRLKILHEERQKFEREEAERMREEAERGRFNRGR